MSWEVIIPFLRPIEDLIRDPEISDILVNGPDRVFIEKFGKLEKVPGVSLSENALQVAIRNIARRLGDDISEAKPMLDARLPDGSRLTAVIAPCSVNGTTLAIRKFQSQLYGPEDLVRIGTLTPELLLQLKTAVELGKNILISGGTGTGKTTLLNALSRFIHSGRSRRSSSRTPRKSRLRKTTWSDSKHGASSRAFQPFPSGIC